MNCPTFGEFVEYLLEQDRKNARLDMHWTPITKFCTPCHIHFDIIAKFETLDEDQRYVIHRARLEKIISPQWKNPGRGKKTLEQNQKYFGQLTEDQVAQLYEIYR